LPMKRRAVEAEALGRARHVPLRFREDTREVALLERLARLGERRVRRNLVRGWAGRAAPGGRAVLGREIHGPDGRPRRHEEDAFDEVLQLAHVARPSPLREGLERLLFERLRAPPALARGTLGEGSPGE